MDGEIETIAYELHGLKWKRMSLAYNNGKCKFLQKYKCIHVLNDKIRTTTLRMRMFIFFHSVSAGYDADRLFIRVGDKKRPAIEITCTVSGCNDNIGWHIPL